LLTITQNAKVTRDRKHLAQQGQATLETLIARRLSLVGAVAFTHV